MKYRNKSAEMITDILAPLFLFFIIIATPSSNIFAKEIAAELIDTKDVYKNLDECDSLIPRISPIAEKFLQEARDSNLFELGTGHSGNVAIAALREGALKYAACDMSRAYLKMLTYNVHVALGKDALKKLSIIHAKAPKGLPESKLYDAILVELVLHSMTPQEIIGFIKWVKQNLKNGGKMYVVTLSPYSKPYKKILPKYIKNLEKKIDFPGYFTGSEIRDIKRKGTDRADTENSIVLFDRAELVRFFERYGMEVIESRSMKLPSKAHSFWQEAPDDSCDAVGAVVINR